MQNPNDCAKKACFRPYPKGMKAKKPPLKAIEIKARPKRNSTARAAVNQKAQVMSDGPKRLGTRRARERQDIEDHA